MVVFAACAGLGALVLLVTIVADDFDFGLFDDGDAPWTARTLSLFLVGFGATGYLLMDSGWRWGGASLGGVGAGVALGAFGYYGGKLLMAQESNSLPNLQWLVGKPAMVVETVGPGIPGQVQTTNEFGHTVYAVALPSEHFLQQQTFRGQPLLLAPGTPVTITGVYGASVLVGVRPHVA